MKRFFNMAKLMTGENALSNLPHELKMKNLSRPMLISDKTEADGPFYKLVKKAFNNDSIKIVSIVTYDKSTAEIEDINKIAEQYKEVGADSLIVIGREAAISVAKMVKLVVEQGVSDIKNINSISNTDTYVPLFVVTVYYGTGDEAQGVAKCYDDKVCYNFVSDSLMPDAVILDSDTVFATSKCIKASAIMYALSAGIMAYTHEEVGNTTRTTAMASLRLLSSTVAEKIFKKSDNNFNVNIAMSTVIAGAALGQISHDDLATMSTIVSRYLKLPYTKVYSMLFPHYFANSLRRDDISYMEVLLPIIGEDRYALTPVNKRIDQVVVEVRRLINYLSKETGFKYNLSDYKMRRDDIAPLVDEMVSKGVDRDLATITMERTF